MKITVTIEVDEKMVLDESSQENIEDAISQELDWIQPSGLYVQSWQFLNDDNALADEEETPEFECDSVETAYDDSVVAKLLRQSLKDMASRERLIEVAKTTYTNYSNMVIAEYYSEDYFVSHDGFARDYKFFDGDFSYASDEELLDLVILGIEYSDNAVEGYYSGHNASQEEHTRKLLETCGLSLDLHRAITEVVSYDAALRRCQDKKKHIKRRNKR